MIESDKRRWWAGECRRAYESFTRAVEDGRWTDALVFATTCTAYIDLGYGDSLPKGARTSLEVGLDELSRDAVNVSPIRGLREVGA